MMSLSKLSASRSSDECESPLCDGVAMMSQQVFGTVAETYE